MTFEFNLPIPTTDDEYYMCKALELALSAYELAEVPIGCVYVYKGQIVCWGKNRTNELLNGTRHAEFEALDLFLTKGYDLEILKETTVYVTCEPCIMCASALKQLGIKKVFYGCKNDKFGGNGSILSVHKEFDGINAPYEAVAGLYREQAIILLRMFYVRENEHAPIPKKKANRTLKLGIPPLEV